MKRDSVAAVLIGVAVATVVATAASVGGQDPLDDRTLSTIRLRFGELIELANWHDLKALHGMFWQSPSVLLVAKSAIPSEGNWAGYWGNAAVDQKLRDIAASGPVILAPDFSRLKVVGLTRDVAESFVPLSIAVSYAGQDGTPKPFLLIIYWIKVAKEWKVASEIILPVPPAPDHATVALVDSAAREGRVIGQRRRRILHDRDLVAVLPQPRVYPTVRVSVPITP